MVQKLCYAPKSVTDGRTNVPEAICPSNFFEVGGIIIIKYSSLTTPEDSV